MKLEQIINEDFDSKLLNYRQEQHQQAQREVSKREQQIESMKRDIVQYAVQVERECRYYLSVHPSFDKVPMLRGTKKSFNKPLNKKTIRKNRKPKDSSRVFHQMVDSYFEEQFHFPARSQGIAVSGPSGDATDYGQTYVIFPIGTFSWVYSQKTKPIVADVYQDTLHLLRKKLISFVEQNPSKFPYTTKLGKNKQEVLSHDVLKILFDKRKMGPKGHKVASEVRPYFEQIFYQTLDQMKFTDQNLTKGLKLGAEINIGQTDQYFLFDQRKYKQYNMGKVIKDIYEGNIEDYVQYME